MEMKQKKKQFRVVTDRQSDFEWVLRGIVRCRRVEGTELLKQISIVRLLILIYYLWRNQSLLSRGGIERFMIYLHFRIATKCTRNRAEISIGSGWPLKRFGCCALFFIFCLLRRNEILGARLYFAHKNSFRKSHQVLSIRSRTWLMHRFAAKTA